MQLSSSITNFRLKSSNDQIYVHVLTTVGKYDSEHFKS